MRGVAVVHISTQPTPRGSSIRAVTDCERDAVEAFLRRYPEYGRLSHFELVVLAETYIDDATRAERNALAAEGVRLLDDIEEEGQ